MKINNKQHGFTLIELMIVVAILGIIVSLAVPSYQDSVRKTARKDAMGSLGGMANALERWKTQNDTYLGAGTTANNTGAPTIYRTQSPADGAAKYNLTILAVTDTSYTLRATPIGSQAQDGYLELLSTGQKRWDADNSNGISGTENTWQ